MRLPLLLLLLSLCAFVAAGADVSLTVHWGTSVAQASASATVEVVASPLLAPATSAVADALWAALAALDADYARYLAWFPYPRYAVGELTQGTWSTQLLAPMLARFLDATSSRRHPAVVAFAAQPAWCFTPAPPPVPADPNVPAWEYANGAPVATLTESLEAYYAVLWRALTQNATVDEAGTPLAGHGLNITHWEIFNENEHEFLADAYPKIYDAIVRDVINAAAAAGGERPRFVGLGGASPARLESFLAGATEPVDAVSLHFRSTSQTRLRPADYEEFFESALYYATFIESYVNPVLHASRQKPALHINEATTVLPMDNDPSQASPPDAYWAASGASFAMLFSLLTQLNVEAVAMAQLSGFPAIPAWNITNPLYPSLSMTDWSTGLPNPRYWVLKMLVDNFPPGSTVVSTTVDQATASSPFCAASDSRSGFPDITLACTEAAATISSIDFASFGMPHGTCGNFTNDTNCNSDGVPAFVEHLCLGKHSCTVPVFPFSWDDNCEGFVESLRVQARCNKGTGTGAPRDFGAVFAIAFLAPNTGARRVLLINKRFEDVLVSLTSEGSKGGTITLIDSETPATGPVPSKLATLKEIALPPFGTALVELEV